MQNIVGILEKVAAGSEFELGRLGNLSSAEVRARYEGRTWNDLRWMLAGEHGLRVVEEDFTRLVATISPMLWDYTQPQTGRIGNGLFLLMGGQVHGPTRPLRNSSGYW